jgi:hypothetical protein
MREWRGGAWETRHFQKELQSSFGNYASSGSPAIRCWPKMDCEFGADAPVTDTAMGVYPFSGFPLTAS